MLINLMDNIKKNDPLHGKFKGLVVDNEDPKKLCRIKCKIEGRLETSDNSKLPWVFPETDHNLGGRPDLSSMSVPEVGSIVEIVFPYDDIYHPFYRGAWQDSDTHQGLFDESYPESYGFIDSVIQWLKINKDNPDVEYFRQTLKDMLKLDKQGNLWINIPKSLILNIGEDMITNIANNETTKTGNNTSHQIGNDLSYKVGNDFNVEVTNNYKEMIKNMHEMNAMNGHSVVSSKTITHNGQTVFHNTGVMFGIVSGNMSSLSQDVSTLKQQISSLESDLEELKAKADQIESKRDDIKQKIQKKAKSLKGTK